MRFTDDTSKRRAIEEQLAESIARGKYAPGSLLPSERALALRFAVSRQTIRVVLTGLQRRGLVYSHQGKGSIVRKEAGTHERRVGVLVSGGRYAQVFESVCGGLAEIARAHGVGLYTGDVSMYAGAESADAAERLAGNFIALRLEGVVFQPLPASAAEATNRRIVDRFISAGIPVVLIGDDIVPFPDRSEFDLVGVNAMMERLRAERRLVAAGARDVRYLLAEEAQSLHETLEGHPEADAWICSSCAGAAMAVEELTALGRKVPEDVRVAGYELPCRQIAQAAFARLMERLSTPTLPPSEIYLTGRPLGQDFFRKIGIKSQKETKTIKYQ